MVKTTLKRNILAYAGSLGFERCGVTDVSPFLRDEQFLRTWLEAGKAGEMDYLQRNSHARAHPQENLPEAQSIIALAANYYSPDSTDIDFCAEGKVARYARGQDYHRILRKRLDALVRYIDTAVPGSVCRTFVDTGPLLERAAAQRAGLGFIGKNTMLITKGLGSWVFLASIVTSLELPQDIADERNCGTCRLCIDACPTDAITDAHDIDARRCISYLTIESKETIPQKLRAGIGSWILGCDICQEVCPHNTRVPRTSIAELASSAGQGSHLSLARLLAIQTDVEFSETFRGTPLLRPGREGMLRNAAIAAVNLGRTDLLPQLEKLAAEDPSALVREHCGWAVQRLSALDMPAPTGRAVSVRGSRPPQT